MFTCKQVSNSLSKQDYELLPWHKKLALKFHVNICAVCGKYNQQVMLMQDSMRHFRKREEEIESQQPGLSEDQKARLKTVVEQNGD